MKLTDIEVKWLNDNIAKIDFLNALTPQQIIQLTNQATPQLIQGNQKVIMEGDEGKAFFLLYSGMVSVWVERNNKRTKLATLKNGQYFGEISLLSGKPTTADVIANMPSKVFFLDPQQFIGMVKANKQLAEHIMKVMDKRLQERETEIAELMQCNYQEVNDAIKNLIMN